MLTLYRRYHNGMAHARPAVCGTSFVTIRPTNYVTSQGEELYFFFGFSPELSDNRITSKKRN